MNNNVAVLINNLGTVREPPYLFAATFNDNYTMATLTGIPNYDSFLQFATEVQVVDDRLYIMDSQLNALYNSFDPTLPFKVYSVPLYEALNC